MQELVVSGMVRMRKVLGTLNPAATVTKYVRKDTLNRHLPAFGFHEKAERESERERERERVREFSFALFSVFVVRGVTFVCRHAVQACSHVHFAVHVLPLLVMDEMTLMS